MRRTIYILICILLIVGCGPPKVDISESPKQFTPSDYEHILELWTRDTNLYILDGMDNVLSVTSTYHSWEFRWGYAVRYSDDHRHSPEERAELRQTEFENYRKFHEFTIATASGNRKWAEFGNEQSIWRVTLSNDRGDEVHPIEIEEIPKPSPAQMMYFPYINVFRNAYKTTFPRFLPNSTVPIIGPDNEYFCLKFAGALGNGKLCWEI